ncbi:MAG: hypothetical protein ACR2OC_09320 [Solirubrobacterales bacterium]
MESAWPIIFLAVVLKIPVACLLYLVYWAIKQTDAPAEAPESEDDHGFRRWRGEPKRPRGPRRGPHAPDARPLPDCPPSGNLRVTRRPAAERVTADRR